MTHPDEVHADLGRALGCSYVSSLHSIASLLSDTTNKEKSSVEVQAAIKRGVRIIQSLVCGEDISKDDKKDSHHENYNKANYASAAYSFFDQVANSIFIKEDKIHSVSVEEIAIRSFIQNQWQQWCIKCEEFAYIRQGTVYSGGGGIHVLNACMKGYASICFMNVRCSESDGNSLDNNCNGSGSLYQSLSQHASRLFLTRACISNALEKVRSEEIEADKLLVECLSPLFYTCVLQARHENHQQQETSQTRHSERQLLLREILWGLSMLLHGVKGDERSINQLACMVEYLSTSLQSYLGQVSMSSCLSSSTNDIATVDLIGLAYDWLRGICDIMRLMVSNSHLELSSVATNNLRTSIETILRYVLPQITSNINFAPVPFEMTSIYVTLHDIVGSFAAEKLLQMADPALALELSTLALGTEDEQELNALCNLIFSIYCSLDSHAIPSAPYHFWVGGILCAVGCLFLPRHSTCASSIKKLGVSLLHNSNVMTQVGKEKVVDNANEDAENKCRLIDILSCLLGKESRQFQFMISIMTSYIANVDEESVLLYKWKRRPLSASDQHGALLIGLSLVHMSLSSTLIGTIEFGGACSYLSTLLKCHPHISARAVPSIIDVVRTCITAASSSSSQLLLEALKFLASPAIVSDPHGASITWNFLSALTNDSVPPTVRSSVLRVLPDMCASNKKLRSRIRAIVGKSLTST